VGYIKNIQRAKKKWFFIQIEDISGNIELFVREVLDLQKFDILVIAWFKGRSLSMEKIIKIDREHLIRQAGSKYNPEMTVVKAKALRLRPTDEHIGEIKKEETTEEIFAPSIEPTTNFTLPDNTKKIDEIITILQTHQWNEEITISNKKVSVNIEWLEKIRDLLDK